MTPDQVLILLAPIAFCLFLTILALLSPHGFDR